MAEHLASIYGTEKDKVNCSFYFKMGACRHGDKCSRKHVKPNFSQTLLLPNLYQNPSNVPGARVNERQTQQSFDLFFEDIFMELAKFGNVHLTQVFQWIYKGEIEEMNVCDNVGDHLVGNVYVRFKWEADAGKADKSLNERYYAGKPLYAELSPVTDFREACCRQYENNECTRGGFCNFMHMRVVTPAIRKDLFQAQMASLKIIKPTNDFQMIPVSSAPIDSPASKPERSRSSRDSSAPYPPRRSDSRDRRDDRRGGDRDRNGRY